MTDGVKDMDIDSDSECYKYSMNIDHNTKDTKTKEAKTKKVNVKEPNITDPNIKVMKNADVQNADIENAKICKSMFISITPKVIKRRDADAYKFNVFQSNKN